MLKSIGLKRLEDFIRTRYDDCLKMAIKYSHSRADAEDSLQEAFVNAFEHIDTYNTTMPFDRWFIRVLINSCLTQVKKPFRAKEVSFTAVEHYWPNIDTSLLDQEDFDTLLVNKIDIEERRGILYEAMRSLNDNQMDLLLIYVCEYLLHTYETRIIGPST